MGSAEMPKTGQGTWPVTDRRECINIVQAGLKIGYHHIDTAQLYDNEGHVGEALNTADVGREELFVATKLAKDTLSREGHRVDEGEPRTDRLAPRVASKAGQQPAEPGMEVADDRL